jgi:hypothetical protein
LLRISNERDYSMVKRRVLRSVAVPLTAVLLTLGTASSAVADGGQGGTVSKLLQTVTGKLNLG